jgi:hypothetical protein
MRFQKSPFRNEAAKLPMLRIPRKVTNRINSFFWNKGSIFVKNMVHPDESGKISIQIIK